MEDQQPAERFKLNMIVLSEDRTREVNFRPDPQQPGKRSREVTMWTRTLQLANNVYVYESSLGEARVVKQVSRRDSRLANYASELDVLGQVSNVMDLQNRQRFVHFHGWFPSSEHVCLVMEYCHFGDISMCYPSPLPEAETRCICEQLLDGLAILHGLGIAHRDIKPQNVLVVQTDPIRMKIADFGISKRALEGQTELRTQIGTQGYMAPEILGLVDEAKEDSAYTSAVDIWSLGCLLYFLLTKETPFGEYEALRDYVKGHTDFPDGRLVERRVGDSARRFIGALLAPAPEDRPTASVNLRSHWVIDQDDTGLPTLSSTDGALTQTPHVDERQDVTLDNPVQSPPNSKAQVRSQKDPILPVDSDTGEEEMNFYTHELWQVLKTTKTKTASAERLVPILDQGANPSTLHDGSNALHLTAEHGSAEWVDILLTYGADTQRTTKPRRESPLHLATWQGDLDIFLKKLRLLTLGRNPVDVNARNSDGDTALHLAIARLGSVDGVKALLAAGATTEHKGRKGHTPLMYAIYLEREEKAIALLDGGASVDCEDENGYMPLHLAIASSRLNVGLIRRLVDAGADINKAPRVGHTPLFTAVKLNRREVVNLLLDHGADCELGGSWLQRRLTQMQLWRWVGLRLPSIFG